MARNVKIDVLPFDPQTASPQMWNRYHRYRRQRNKEREPEDPVPSDRTIQALMKRQDPQSEVIGSVVVKAGQPDRYIGSLQFEIAKEGTPSWEDNRDTAWVDLEVLAPYRGKGVGRRLLQEVVALAQDRGRSVLIGGTHEEDGRAFLRAIGAQVGLHTRQSRLYLEEVDWPMVEAWVAEGPDRSPGSELEFHTDLMTGSFLEGYCDLMTQVFNQMPRGDLSIGDEVFTPETVRAWVEGILNAGGVKLTALTREPDGTLSGVTEMGYFPDRPTFIHQYMTGVQDACRGRGLGKWLKAAMLLHVRDAHPEVEVVVTYNATVNVPMLSINERLGFRPHWEGDMAQISVEDAEAYLEKRAG